MNYCIVFNIINYIYKNEISALESYPFVFFIKIGNRGHYFYNSNELLYCF